MNLEGIIDKARGQRFFIAHGVANYEVNENAYSSTSRGLDVFFEFAFLDSESRYNIMLEKRMFRVQRALFEVANKLKQDDTNVIIQSTDVAEYFLSSENISRTCMITLRKLLD